MSRGDEQTILARLTAATLPWMGKRHETKVCTHAAPCSARP